MEVSYLLYLSLLVDLLIIAALALVAFKLGSRRQDRVRQEKASTDFQKLIVASEQAGEELLRRLETMAGGLEKTLKRLEKKEKELLNLLGGIEDKMEEISSFGPRQFDEETIGRLLDSGFHEREISRITGLSEGEVSLIADFHRARLTPS